MMGTKMLSAAAAAVVLLGGPCGAVEAQVPALAAGQHITIVGVIKKVEAAPDRLTFAGDDRRTYTLDISRARVTVPGQNQPKLIAGMRAYVSGQGSVGGSIAVSRLQVLPTSVPAPVPASPVIVNAADPLDFTVRGTVEAIDFEHGSFVLRINTHTRIIFVTADTNVTGLGFVSANQFPVQPGQRVTVGGSLQPDGTVLAGLLTAHEDVDYRNPPDQPNRVLVGDVSSGPNKLRGRDIKIRLADGSETKILVPRNIPVRRLGRPISVYDLSSRDQVRVTGRITGTDFHAARIDVLAPLPFPATPIAAPSPQSRPGL